MIAPAPLKFPLVVWSLVTVCAGGCAQRERFNKSCEWTGDAAVRLDLRNNADRRHLVDDAQLAEELAVRYADFQHAKPYGYEGHGGYLNGGKVGNGCLAKLVGIIEESHGVTDVQVIDARRYRDRRFDAAVVASFGLIYAIASMVGAQSVTRAVVLHGAPIWTMAMSITSRVAAAAGVQFLSMWAAIAEMLRVGNDHLGVHMRAAVSPWMQPGLRVFVGGVVLYWAAAIAASRRPHITPVRDS